MAAILSGGRYRVLDWLGNPAFNAKVYTYEAGTLTPKATFVTRTAQVANANPVRTDATGQCSIFLGPGVTRFRVLDANDAMLPDGDFEVEDGSSAGVLSQLAGSAGDSLLAVLQPFTGAVPATQHAANAQYTFGHQFGIDPTGSVDSTVALQNLVNSKRNPKLDYGSTVKVSSVIDLPSACTLDLNFSTVNWAGAVVDNSNKTARWNNAVFRCNTLAPSTVKYGVAVLNGTINCNNWGCGVSLKQVEAFRIERLAITNAVAAGIHIADCIDGTIDSCKLTDCAANPTSGFDAATDLEGWSDGIIVWYGSQAVSIVNCTVVNTRAATGRGGIVVDDAAAGSVESGRKTSAITVRACTVKGYDRQVHLEYCHATSVEDCDLDFVDSGAKTIKAAVVDWNTQDTVWKNCRVRTSKGIAMITGSVNVLVMGGSWKKTGADTATNAFANQGAVQATVRFKAVDLDVRASNANIYRWDVLFEDCNFGSAAWTNCDVYEGKFRWVRTAIVNSHFTNRYGLATDRMSFEDCSFIGFAGASYCASAPAGKAALYLRKVLLEPGDVRFSCATTVTINDMELNTLPTIDGSPAWVQLDGEFLTSSVPAAGAWVKGQKMRNTNPAAGTNYGWVCTTSGTPGTWKTYGAIAA